MSGEEVIEPSRLLESTVNEAAFSFSNPNPIAL